MADENIQRASEKIDDAVTRLSDSFKTFSEAGYKNSNMLEDLENSFGKIADSTKSVLAALKSLGLDSSLANGLVGNISAVVNFEGAMSQVLNAVDSLDKGLRGLEQSQFKYAASLGLSYSESEKFVQSFRDIIDANSQLSQKGLYIGSKDVKDTIEVMQKAGISIEELSKKSSVAVGEGKESQLTYAQLMAAQAESMGMAVSEYSSKIASMIRKTGISFEESAEIMARAQDLSKQTGLTVDEVTSSLQNSTNAFQKMGMTMDFGRPILKGFADSVKEVGLGISQATDFASSFTQSLGKIIDNPALAYITSMNGGFNSGGGVLSSSIQMQAQMMDQSPGSQAELAKNLSQGMKETLQNITGGKIITVKEAAESPELSTSFTSQQKLLGSMYGISGTSDQNMVLQYLSDLADAQDSGDEEAQKLLEKQINETLTANDKTFGIQEKMSQSLESIKFKFDEQLQLNKLAALKGLTDNASFKSMTAKVIEHLNEIGEGKKSEGDQEGFIASIDEYAKKQLATQQANEEGNDGSSSGSANGSGSGADSDRSSVNAPSNSTMRSNLPMTTNTIITLVLPPEITAIISGGGSLAGLPAVNIEHAPKK